MTLSDSPSVIAPSVAVNDPAGDPVDGADRTAVALTCAASAGVHLALVPPHYAEAGLPLAVAFSLSAIALAVGALLLRRPPTTPWTGALPPLVLAGVAAGYLFSRTSGIPLLIAEPEPFEVLGLITTAAEVIAAAAAVWLLLNRKEHR